MLLYAKLDLEKLYGPQYIKGGLAFMYTDAKTDVV